MHLPVYSCQLSALLIRPCFTVCYFSLGIDATFWRIQEDFAKISGKNRELLGKQNINKQCLRKCMSKHQTFQIIHSEIDLLHTKF